MNLKYIPKASLATFMLIALSGCMTVKAPQTTTEKLFYGGSILTMEGMQPKYAEALLVRDGKIVFVGSKQQAERLADIQVQYINLNNKTLLPSFIDAHSHVNMVGFHQMVANLYPMPDGSVSDINSLVNVMNTWKTQNPTVIKTMGGWILGNGYDGCTIV